LRAPADGRELAAHEPRTPDFGLYLLGLLGQADRISQASSEKLLRSLSDSDRLLIFADVPEIHPEGAQLTVQVGALHADPLGELADFAIA